MGGLKKTKLRRKKMCFGRFKKNQAEEDMERRKVKKTRKEESRERHGKKKPWIIWKEEI